MDALAWDEYSAAGVRIEKLNDKNYYSWLQEIELVLAYRKVDDMIDSRVRPEKPTDKTKLSEWIRKDKTARMIIGLSISDEMLLNVSHTTTALEMWKEITDVHQRHKLLNKYSARRDFYTATMAKGEKMLVYMNRVRQTASILQAMDVEIDDKEMAMAILNGLPPRFSTLITELDAIGDDDESFTLENIRSRLLWEEKRWDQQLQSESSNK